MLPASLHPVSSILTERYNTVLSSMEVIIYAYIVGDGLDSRNVSLSVD